MLVTGSPVLLQVHSVLFGPPPCLIDSFTSHIILALPNKPPLSGNQAQRTCLFGLTAPVVHQSSSVKKVWMDLLSGHAARGNLHNSVSSTLDISILWWIYVCLNRFSADTMGACHLSKQSALLHKVSTFSGSVSIVMDVTTVWVVWSTLIWFPLLHTTLYWNRLFVKFVKAASVIGWYYTVVMCHC